VTVEASAWDDSVKGYPHDEVVRWMRQVPAIYRQIGTGKHATTYLAERDAPDPETQVRARTAVQLLEDSPSSRPLLATLQDGRLAVTDGHHRIAAARDAGVPVIPVQVSARTDGEIREAVSGWGRLDVPTYRACVASHAELDRQRVRQRGRPSTPSPVREPTGPDRW
jgi:hypothetical protein